MRSIASCALIGNPRCSINGFCSGPNPGTPAANTAPAENEISAATIAADRTKRMAASSLELAVHPSELRCSGREVHLRLHDVKRHAGRADRRRVIQVQDMVVARVMRFVGVERSVLTADLGERYGPGDDKTVVVQIRG